MLRQRAARSKEAEGCKPSQSPTRAVHNPTRWRGRVAIACAVGRLVVGRSCGPPEAPGLDKQDGICTPGPGRCPWEPQFDAVVCRSLDAHASGMLGQTNPEQCLG